MKIIENRLSKDADLYKEIIDDLGRLCFVRADSDYIILRREESEDLTNVFG